MPSRRPALVLALLAVPALAACPGSPPTDRPDASAPDAASPWRELGGFRVESEGGALRVSSAADPERVYLETAASGEGMDAPLATRRAYETWQMQFGYFKVSDGDQPWRGAAIDETAGIFLDAAGATVATLTASSPAEGALLLSFKAQNPLMNRLSVSFACAADDRFLGFGAQTDALDHRGHTIPIWTSEQGIGKTDTDEPPALWYVQGARHSSYMGLPTWLSQRGYVGVVESDRRSVFELCSRKSDAFRVETWGDELRLWLYSGDTPAKALERATAGVLRRPARPPPLAFAPWNDAIFGAAKVREVAALLRGRSIPSSALWSEDFRGGSWELTGYRLKEEWDLDPALYPEATALAAELRAQGFAWLAYFNSFINQDTRVWDEATRDGHFVKEAGGGPYLFEGILFKPSGLADLSRPATREWAKGYLRKALDVGFDGWMTDFGEWLPHDAVLDSGEDPLAAHNRYSAEWSRLSHEVLEERAGDGRQRVFFARSGWLGSTEFTPIYWAGDQRTDFQADDGLPTVIPIGLGLGLAGVSTFAHDIGGYQSATNAPATKELFFRWTSFGALSPVMRTHHGTDPANQWWFGQDEETLLHYQRWAGFHIRLFPYLDGGAAVAEATGLPLMRALPLAFPEDPAGWSQMEEYLLGPALLVAPVVEQGATSRQVHFPPGEWLPLSGGPSITGPADLPVEAPLTEIPLFGRAGGLVPMLPEGVQTLLPAQAPVVDLASVEDRRVVLVFAGAAGSFAERDGTTYRLEPTSGSVGGFVEAGSALPECGSEAERGCVEPTTAAGTRIRLAGQGPIEFGAWRLTIAGPARTIDLVVRR